MTHTEKAHPPGENLISDISCFLWWNCTMSSNVSELTTTKLPENKYSYNVMKNYANLKYYKTLMIKLTKLMT